MKVKRDALTHTKIQKLGENLSDTKTMLDEKKNPVSSRKDAQSSCRHRKKLRIVKRNTNHKKVDENSPRNKLNAIIFNNNEC